MGPAASENVESQVASAEGDSDSAEVSTDAEGEDHDFEMVDSVVASEAEDAEALSGVEDTSDLEEEKDNLVLTSQREPAADLQVQDLFQSLRKTLYGITNVDSAKSSVEELEDWATGANELADTSTSWNEITRKKVNLEIEYFLPVLSRSVESVMTMEQVEPVIEKPMNGVMEALDRLVPAE